MRHCLWNDAYSKIETLRGEQSIYRFKGVILPVRVRVPLKTLRYLVVECGNSYQIQIQNANTRMLRCMFYWQFSIGRFRCVLWTYLILFVFLSPCRWKLKRVLLCRFIYRDWFLMCTNKKRNFFVDFCKRRKSFSSIHNLIFWYLCILCYSCQFYDGVKIYVQLISYTLIHTMFGK